MIFFERHANNHERTNRKKKIMKEPKPANKGN